mmetsp:Transcript_6143/g.14822  ORF Transcript_6143/g.14822 Transcript_6143/m.14822 type:complete len:694 (-) Transcript_6143:320-2401(-)
MGNFCSSIKADENKRGNGILELKPQNNGVSINSTNSATNNTQVAASETRQTPQENRGASEQLSKQRKGSGEAEVIVSCNGSKLERLAVEYLSNEVGGDREVFGDGKNKRNTCNSEGEDKASVSEHDEAEKTIRWQKGELIGAGAFGRVYLGLNLDTAELMAVKQVSISKEEDIQSEVADRLTKLEAEVNVLKQLHHPNIVRYLGTERCFHNMTLNIFLEFVPGGSIASLLQRFGTFTESVMRVYTKQILLGLDFLHKHQIMHRDIKGANILVDNSGVVKLADFGASKKIENLVTMDSGYKSIKGTPYWMAPEVIKATGHGRQADIWSVGCTVIEMATGKPPWSEFKEPMSAMYQIASSKEPPPIPEHLSPEARDFLLLCFNRVPKERPNASRLLQHPFLSQATPGGRTPPSRVAPARPPATPNLGPPPAGGMRFTSNKPLSPVVEVASTVGTPAADPSPADPGMTARAASPRYAPGTGFRMPQGAPPPAPADADWPTGSRMTETASGTIESVMTSASYNPMEEPTWVEQGTESSIFMSNGWPKPQPIPLYGKENRGSSIGSDNVPVAEGVVEKKQQRTEGTEENIMQFVRSKADQDIRRLSIPFSVQRLGASSAIGGVMEAPGLGNGGLSPSGAGHRAPPLHGGPSHAARRVSKSEQWEAELREELEAERLKSKTPRGGRPRGAQPPEWQMVR